MKRFMGTLYGRISVTYLVLLVLFSAMSVFATLRFASRFTYESDQELNRNLAQVFHERITPYLGDSLDAAALKYAFTDFMTVNPRVDIYLVDTEGRIVSSSVATEELELDRVALAPIVDFVEGQEGMPILGDDPRTAGQQKIFSATPIEMGQNRQGYVYVVLLSKLYDSVASLVRDDYILRTAVVNLFLVFLFTSLAGLLVLAFVTRPFRRLTHTVEAFEAGDLARRIPHTDQSELGRLAQSINGMADTVQEHITVLQERDDLRREFIANISHDLRSPLTTIQGYVETALIKNETLATEERHALLQIIYEETMRLGQLISQLLQLSRLDAENIRPEPEPFALSELVQDLILKYHPESEKRGLLLTSTLPTNLPLVYADIGLIERALANLVENALRYTPEGGHVKIGGTPANGHIHIDVSDTGCGIASEDLPHVTERFYKGRPDMGRTAGGTGLGLAIVQRILELHDSTLSIESAKGKGTCVSFDLDVADA